MNQQLALTVLSENQPSTLSLLTQFLASHRIEIQSSRMLVLGNEFAMLLLINAPWNEIAKLETQLPSFAQQHRCLIQFKRTESQSNETQEWLSYSAEFVSRDPTSEITNNICQFFADAGALVYEMTDRRYTTNFIGSPMYALTLRILIPADTLLSDLRERFVTLADFLNVEAYFEPERN